MDADWFNLEASWQPYLPLPAEGVLEWYFQLDQSTLADQNSIPPLCMILPHSLTVMEEDLHLLEECIVAITKSSIFPMRGT